MQCPCFSGKMYARCCEPCHKGELPPTCEELMRSRYSAYALGLVDYIVQTTSRAKRPGDIEAWKREIGAFCSGTEFIGLTIESTGEMRVTFYARLRQKMQAGGSGRDMSFREESLFAREEGRLVYVEGSLTR